MATDWLVRHNAAMEAPKGDEVPIVLLWRGCKAYAETYRRAWGSDIGADYVLGPCFASILSGLRGLLNGPTGRLDCGTLDAAILALAASHGIDCEVL